MGRHNVVYLKSDDNKFLIHFLIDSYFLSHGIKSLNNKLEVTLSIQ